MLDAAGKLWLDVSGEFAEPPEGVASDDGTGEGINSEELKKVSLWLQRSLTKFGASAAVADASDEQALRQVANQVVTALTAAVGTLLTLRRGAGPSLRAELRDVTSDLCRVVEGLGAAVGTEGMALNAGKALERVKRLERVSLNSRAAVRRRILTSLAQLRDARRELQEELKDAGGDGDSDEDDEDDEEDFGLEKLDPAERDVAQKLDEAAGAVEAALMRASKRMGSAAQADAAGAVPAFEACAVHAAAAVRSVDELATHVIGGLDSGAFAASLQKLREAAEGLAAAEEPDGVGELGLALDALGAALASAESGEDAT